MTRLNELGSTGKTEYLKNSLISANDEKVISAVSDFCALAESKSNEGNLILGDRLLQILIAARGHLPLVAEKSPILLRKIMNGLLKNPAEIKLKNTSWDPIPDSLVVSSIAQLVSAGYISAAAEMCFEWSDMIPEARSGIRVRTGMLRRVLNSATSTAHKVILSDSTENVDLRQQTDEFIEVEAIDAFSNVESLAKEALYWLKDRSGFG